MSLLQNILGKRLDVREQKVVNDVREHGCHVTHVSGEDDAPAFSFSIGFAVSVGQPEVIVFGLKSEVMHSMVNEIRRQCATGFVLSDGAKISDLIEGFECVVRHVTDAEAIKVHFGWAVWYHRSQMRKELIEAYQIVWPGALDGLYPWDAGCNEVVIASQPALYKTSLH